MKKLIRQIRSLGSRSKPSVCLLSRQKPEDVFMTPTYIIGGSDSSHTRQGGVHNIILLAAMVLGLLGATDRVRHRENNIHLPPMRGNTIDQDLNIFSAFTVFSLQRAIDKP